MYKLYYWTGIPGRGEFVRLALEAAGAKYQDVARQKGDGVIEAFGAKVRTPSFAPPYLVDGDIVVGQTAAILHYLGPTLGLVPRDPRLRLWVHQIQLTIADFVRYCRELRPKSKVIAITRCTDPAVLAELLQSGAPGYLLKRSVPAELVRAIRMVLSGSAYVDPAIASKLLVRTNPDDGVAAMH